MCPPARPVTILTILTKGAKMKNIVVGYDGSEPAKRALERAAEIAQGATVTVVSAVHVLAPVGRAAVQIDPDEIAERRGELAEAKALLSGKGVAVKTVESHGDPADGIVETAKESGADLIVVGTRGANLASRVLLGSVSTKVVHEAPCDVLVVR